MIALEPWHKVVLYILLLGAIFIFVKTSQIKINNRPVIRLEYRLLLAIFFPVVLALALIFGSLIFAIALAGLALVYFYSKATKKRFRINLVRKRFKKPLE